MPVGAPTPEQLVAEMLAKQRAEAEAEHQRRIAEWEAAQRAKFEEEVAERRREVRERYGMDPLGVFLAQRYEWVARQRFESSLLMEKSRLQREFEESWRRYEESVKPSLLESAGFWLSMGYPQYAGRYAPVSIPEGARITRVTETPEGLRVEYSLAEAAQETSESARREMERRSAAQPGPPAGPPEYLGLPQPPLPEGAINPVVSIKEATPVGVKAELIYWVPVPGERGFYQPVKQEVYIAPGEGGGEATYLSAEQAREKAMQIAREQLAPSLPAGFEVKSVEIKPEGIEAKIGPTEAYVVQVEELVKNYKEWAKSVEPTDIERVQHMVRVGAYLSSLVESFKQYNVTLPSVSEEYARAKAMHESWVQASVDFWTRMGRPELGGRYPPIELPKGAVITKVEETAEGVRVEYVTEEQLRLQKTLEESREKWERFGAAEYAGKYEFPGMLEGYRTAGKTVLPGVGEVYETYKRSEYHPDRSGLPVPDVYAPEKAYIKLEEAGGELLVTILTPQQVAQIQETKRSEELWRQLGLEEYAGKYLFPGELEGYRAVGKTTLPEVGEVYVLAGPPHMELSGYLKIAEEGGQLLYSLISAEQASALKMREEWKKTSMEFWANLGLSEYAGKYAPLDQLTGYKLAGYMYGTEGRYVILEKDGEKIYAQFREEGDKLTVTIYPKNVFEELYFVKTTGQPTIKSLSLQAYEWAENINIPVIEELAKHLVGAFSFIIDKPAYWIAQNIAPLLGRKAAQAEFPPIEDIAYATGHMTGAVGISLLTGGLAGIPAAATLKWTAISGGISATVTAAHSLLTGQPITPGQVIHAAAKGMAYAGIGQAGYMLLARAVPAVAAGAVTGKLTQIGYAGAYGAGVGYIETGDVRQALIAGGISAGLAALILFGVQPAYHEIKARLGRTVRLEPAGTTVGGGGRETEVYETYLKELDMRLRVVADYTERPVGAPGVTRESLIQEYLGRDVATAHATLQFDKFARPGEDILLRGFPEAAAGVRRAYQLYYFYSAPGGEDVITVYGAYMGLSGEYSGARVVFGGKPGVVATLRSYISPESLMRPGETITEYLWRITTSSGKVYIAPETVLGWSLERQVVTPAAYVRFGVQLPGSYYHVEKVLPQTFEIVQYPGGWLGKIPVLRTMFARYFDFRVAVGEFRPVAEALAVSSKAEAISAAKALSTAPSAMLSTQPTIHVSPSAVSIPVSITAALISTWNKSAGTWETSVAPRLKESSEVVTMSRAASLPAGEIPSLALSRIREDASAQLTIISASASRFSETVIRETQRELSAPPPVVPRIMEKVIEMPEAAKTSSASIPSYPQPQEAALQPLQSLTAPSISISPTVSTPSPATESAQPISIPSIAVPSISSTSEEKKVFGEWVLPALGRRVKELGFIYERPRPITAAEEQIRKLKRDLKIDPHVFLEAPELPAKKKVKAEVKQVPALSALGKVGKESGLGKLRALAEIKPTKNIMKDALGRKSLGVAFITGAAEKPRRMRSQIKMETPKPQKEPQKMKTFMLLSPPETKKREKREGKKKGA